MPHSSINSILEFLINRNIFDAEQICQEMDLNKVDIKVLSTLSEDDILLSKWLPKLEDRIAIINWSKQIQSKEINLFKELPGKVLNDSYEQPHNDKEKDGSVQSLLEKVIKNNVRNSIKVQIGWLHCDLKYGFKKISKSLGGGIKEVECSLTSKLDDLLQISKLLFFGKDNKSIQGCWEEFETIVVDFKQNCIGHNITIQDLCDFNGDTGLPMYYLVTKYKDGPFSPNSFTTLEHLFGSTSFTSTVPSTSTMLNNIEPAILENQSASFDQMNSDSQNNNVDTGTDNDIQGASSSINLNLETVRSPRVTFNQRQSDCRKYYYVEQGEETSEPLLFSRRHNTLKRNKFTFHRGNIFDEMLETFKYTDKQGCEGVFIELIHPNGFPEQGVDTGGVLRDTLSEFWTTMYDTCTIGTDLKIPYICHNFKEEKWIAMAKVLYMGWINSRYLPIKLAMPIIEQILFGHVTSKLIPPFLQTLSVNDKHVLSRALLDFSSVEKDDIITILDNLECRVIPNVDNFKEILEEIAHKELVQKPYFIIKQFQVGLNSLDNNLSEVLTEKKLYELYKSMPPTIENILNILLCDYTNDTEDEKITFGFLKKFITETSTENRLKFIRFCTGADVITGNQIVVKFSNPEWFNQYAPMAHTCSCVLQLPLKYLDYDHFESEMSCILTSNVWTMDSY